MQTPLRLRTHKTLILLTYALVLIHALAVGDSDWTAGLNVVVPISVAAATIGLIAARSRLPGLVAHIFSLTIGLGFTFWVIARILAGELTWRMRWQTMVDHLSVWLQIAIEGGVNYDNIMFLFQMGLIMWGISYFTVWFMFRSASVWAAIIPTGVVLLINVYYAPNDLFWWFIAYLLVSLMTIIHFNVLQREAYWRRQRIHFRADIGFDFFRDGLVFSVLLLTLAWSLPAMGEAEAQKIFQAGTSIFDREWRTLQDEWNRIFAGLNYDPEGRAQANNFSQSLNLGGPRKLSPEPVMIVNAPQGRYWRAVTFDEYTGLGWESNDEDNVDFQANTTIPAVPFYRARDVYTQTYTTLGGGNTILYAMGQPLRIDRSGQGKTSIVPVTQNAGAAIAYWGGQSQPWHQEVTYLESDRRLQADESYQVISSISTATRQDLRNDRPLYPAWVTSRYLQLPNTIPDRVFDLAQEITAEATTPFDKATLIEQYLRQSIIYNEAIAAPPPGVDKVDYVLFESKQGYCDYYASAMIVMLRSVGVPARMAAGYAGGESETLDSQERVYFVQNRHAHSWVEVFFPQYGWITFEPTAAQPQVARRNEQPVNSSSDNEQAEDFNPIDRAQDIDDLPEDTPPEEANTAPPFVIRLPFWDDITISRNVALGFGVLLALTLAAIVVWWLYQRLVRTATPEGHTAEDGQPEGGKQPSVQTVYQAMLRLAAWMGYRKRIEQTPFEHAAQLTSAVPNVQPDIEFVTQTYVAEEYSRHSTAPAAETQRSLLQRWENMRPAFYKAIFQNRNPLRNVRLPFKW